MFRHLLKLIWKRKGRNVMLSLEILIAFIIVFGIAAAALRNLQLYQMPTGVDRTDVWAVDISGVREGHGLTGQEYDQLKRGLLALPGTQKVAFTSSAPYAHSSSGTSFHPEPGRRVRTEVADATDGFCSLLGIPLIAGRDFEPADESAAALPVILNRRMALAMFGTIDVVGKRFDSDQTDGGRSQLKWVVGVVEDYRKQGDFAAPGNMALVRPASSFVDGPRTILIKVAPGTPRAFEEALSRQLKSINNTLTYRIVPLESLRTAALNDVVTPLIVLSVIAAFLLLMVAFGLFGVLWQNTTRRIPEIGLRRAIGAHAGDIYRQIIAEQFLLSSGAMLVALLLLVQLPITGVLGDMLNWKVFAEATVVSMAAIYLLSLVCSVYPGWRASRLSPNQALHYE